MLPTEASHRLMQGVMHTARVNVEHFSRYEDFASMPHQPHLLAYVAGLLHAIDLRRGAFTQCPLTFDTLAHTLSYGDETVDHQLVAHDNLVLQPSGATLF